MRRSVPSVRRLVAMYREADLGDLPLGDRPRSSRAREGDQRLIGRRCPGRRLRPGVIGERLYQAILDVERGAAVGAWPLGSQPIHELHDKVVPHPLIGVAVRVRQVGCRGTVHRDPFVESLLRPILQCDRAGDVEDTHAGDLVGDPRERGDRQRDETEHEPQQRVLRAQLALSDEGVAQLLEQADGAERHADEAPLLLDQVLLQLFDGAQPTYPKALQAAGYETAALDYIMRNSGVTRYTDLGEQPWRKAVDQLKRRAREKRQ